MKGYAMIEDVTVDYTYIDRILKESEMVANFISMWEGEICTWEEDDETIEVHCNFNLYEDDELDGYGCSDYTVIVHWYPLRVAFNLTITHDDVNDCPKAVLMFEEITMATIVL